MNSPIRTEQAQAWADAGLPPILTIRWSWFWPTLAEFVFKHSAQPGLRLQVDKYQTARAFFEWVSLLEQSERYSRLQPVDHLHFVSGLLLRCLLAHRCIQATPSSPRTTDWPEGHVVMSFVCTLLQAYRSQHVSTPLQWQQALYEKHGVSFRENFLEDVDSAGPFLDYFLGLKPVWDFPLLPGVRPAVHPAQAATA